MNAEMAPGQPGARWSVADAAESLFDLAYLELGCARILLGWLPKLESLALKLDLAEYQYHTQSHATELRRRATSMLRATCGSVTAQAGTRQLLCRLDGAPSVEALLGGLQEVLLPELHQSYRTHLEGTDPVADAPSLRLIRGRLLELEEFWSGMDAQACPDSFCQALTQLCSARRQGAFLSSAELLWAPVDRVPQAARSSSLRRCDAGSLGLLTVDSVGEERDLGIYLHSDLDEEITTLELMARNSYEHPEMPEAFHRDMSRHVADEARHARQVLALMDSRGFSYGDFPISTGSYDGLYEFEPCEAGSEKELLWRMLIRQTFMEGLALDSLVHDIQRRKAAHQYDIAQALDFILADEVYHAASGQRWCRHIVGDGQHALLQARYEALRYFTQKAEKLRAEFVQRNLEKAMGEVAIIEEGKRRRGGKLPERPLNRLGREQAGFSSDDILQVLSWGYATE